jgi:hypothetical protein
MELCPSSSPSFAHGLVATQIVVSRLSTGIPHMGGKRWIRLGDDQRSECPGNGNRPRRACGSSRASDDGGRLVSEEERHGLDPRMDTQLREEALHVTAHRRLGDEQLCCHVLRGCAVRQKSEDVELAGSEGQQPLGLKIRVQMSVRAVHPDLTPEPCRELLQLPDQGEPRPIRQALPPHDQCGSEDGQVRQRSRYLPPPFVRWSPFPAAVVQRIHAHNLVPANDRRGDGGHIGRVILRIAFVSNGKGFQPLR